MGMNPVQKFAHERALRLAATNPKEAFRLLLASDEDKTSNEDQEGKDQDQGQDDQGQEGQGQGEQQKTASMDPQQEELFDALMLIAENDGDAYRKRDAAMAVASAWAEWKKEHDQNLREDFRAIQKNLVKALQAQWARAEAESRM
jgi:hypothetical protein